MVCQSPVSDFDSSQDLIIISGEGFGGGLTPDQAISRREFVLGNRATESSHRFIYNLEEGNLFFDPDGNGPESRLAIARLLDTPDISRKQILVS